LKAILDWSRGFSILVVLHLAGASLSRWLDLFLPGSLVGMLLLVLLFSGVLKLELVETVDAVIDWLQRGDRTRRQAE